MYKMNSGISNKLSRFIRTNVSIYQKVTPFCTKSQDAVIPVNPLKEVYSATSQKQMGKVYDKKPFKIRCIAGKTYSWCSCGHSKNQPFCDGMHRNIYLKITMRPIRFTVTETKDYWICNCKQTSNRPFCDGTHKRQDIQEIRC